MRRPKESCGCVDRLQSHLLVFLCTTNSFPCRILADCLINCDVSSCDVYKLALRRRNQPENMSNTKTFMTRYMMRSCRRFMTADAACVIALRATANASAQTAAQRVEGQRLTSTRASLSTRTPDPTVQIAARNAELAKAFAHLDGFFQTGHLWLKVQRKTFSQAPRDARPRHSLHATLEAR